MSLNITIPSKVLLKRKEEVDMKKKYFAGYLLILLIIFTACHKKNDDINPASNATIYAKADGEDFNGQSPEKSTKLGFTLKTTDGNRSVTIGTDMPPSPGTYTLGRRDPFSGQNYFASYINADGTEYRTMDNAGTLNISSVTSDNNDVTSIKGTFSFTASSPDGKQVKVENGRINY
jgi:hypothetical protein